MTTPTCHREVIDLWPSMSEFADAVGEAYGTVKAMRRRNSIPVNYWPRLIADAERRNFQGVTYEALTLMHASRKESGEPAESAA